MDTTTVTPDKVIVTLSREDADILAGILSNLRSKATSERIIVTTKVLNQLPTYWG